MKNHFPDSKVWPCPLCHEREFETLKSNDRYGMHVVTVGCRNCGLVQTNPRPGGKELTRFYENDYRRFYQNVVTPSEDYIKQNNKHVRMAYTVGFLQALIENHSIEKILDVGCSEGAFFVALRDSGYCGELFGVEPNPEFARFAERVSGVKVAASVEELEGKYDLIVLSHVFEHFLNPDWFLIAIKEKMNPRGLLYIDVPDADEYSSLADLHIAHLFHFTKRTLEDLMRVNGFQIVVCERHSPPGHPKSLRIVVFVDPSGRKYEIASSCHTESAAWMRIRRIKVFGYLLRRKLSSYRVLRSLYRGLLRRE